MSPQNEYLIVRLLPNGQEIVLDRFSIVSQEEDNQAVVALAADAARRHRTNNPAWRILIYGPSNTDTWTRDDVIWDSLTEL